MKILQMQKASFLSRWTKAWVKGGIKLLKIFLFCRCLPEVNLLSQAIEGGRQPNPPLVLLSPLNLQLTPDINQSCISGLFHCQITVGRLSKWSKMMRDGAGWCKMVQDGARWCKLVQAGARWCRTETHGATFCKIAENGDRWCNVMQDGDS